MSSIPFTTTFTGALTSLTANGLKAGQLSACPWQFNHFRQQYLLSLVQEAKKLRKW